MDLCRLHAAAQSARTIFWLLCIRISGVCWFVEASSSHRSFIHTSVVSATIKHNAISERTLSASRNNDSCRDTDIKSLLSVTSKSRESLQTPV